MNTLLTIWAYAPSNIALIKYMGKKNSLNYPENGSLSLTLRDLGTWVQLHLETQGGLVWEPSLPECHPDLKSRRALIPANLRDQEIDKIRHHVRRLRDQLGEILRPWGLTMDGDRLEHLRLRSASSFPHSAGLASSASSFAALTLALCALACDQPFEFKRILKEQPQFQEALAGLSRQGSGSSCRSLGGPFVYWHDDRVQVRSATHLPPLSHRVLLIQQEPKTLSSSAAHLLVKSSPLWKERIGRAEDRVNQSLRALDQGDFARLAELAWVEAWDMHSLFHTAAEPFTYWEPQTLAALKSFRRYFGVNRDSTLPRLIVTCDAGPNLHLITLASDHAYWVEHLTTHFPNLPILEDQAGSGAEFVGQ